MNNEEKHTAFDRILHRLFLLMFLAGFGFSILAVTLTMAITKTNFMDSLIIYSGLSSVTICLS